MVEVISLHIPKTAGTAFRLILGEIYGEQHVWRLNLDPEGQVKPSSGERPQTPRAIHGHFRLSALRRFLGEPLRAPVITWIRHPVDRVISNYYALLAALNRNLRPENDAPNIVRRMARSLIEYAQQPGERNRMSRFLLGELDAFAFLGQTESFAEDLSVLSARFGWPAAPAIEANRTPGKPADVDAAARQRIAELNQVDVAIYERALARRRELIDT